MRGLNSLINNPECSDITFIVEGKEFYGHKAIISILSSQFNTMFKNGWKEASYDKIEIKDISYPVFSSIMRYLYTGTFEFGAEMEG